MDVRTNQFLEGFTPAGREKLIGHLIYQRLAAGDYLFREGDPAEGVCLVLDGQIDIVKSADDADELLSCFEAGDFLGEVAVLDGQGRSTDARARVDSSVAWIPTVDLLEVLTTEPVTLTIHLFQNVLKLLRRTNDRFVDELVRKEKLSLIGEMSSSLMHDIRNPVQVILSSVELVRINHSDPETLDCCQKMETQCDRLVAMAGELLEFSRGESTLKLERTDTTTLLRQFMAFNENTFRPVGTTFNVEDEPADIEVNSMRLLRVLQNLSSNAVEALKSKPGGIIDVRAWVRDSMLHISVRDNGPGIPPEVQARIFDPFVTHGKKGGTGLGLAIVKNIVAAHRGKIAFETEAGQGTRTPHPNSAGWFEPGGGVASLIVCLTIFEPLDKADAFTHALSMTSLPVTQARSRLYQLLDEAAESHEPIQITGKRSNAVLVTEDDWRSIQETLYLISIPGMRDSIRKGMGEPLGKASRKPGW